MAKKSSSNFKWILAFGLFIAAVVYFQAGKAPDKPQPTPESSYNLDKTGAGVVLDYLAASNKIHTAVDNALASTNFKPQEVKETRREVPRKGIEGTIRWHARQMLVTLPEGTSPESLQQSIESAINKAGGSFLGSEPDTYNGQPAQRFDIGLQEKLNGEPLTLVTDRLFVARGKNVTNTKPKSVTRQGDMAIVIDDFGYTRGPIAGFAEMGRPITFAVLPYRQYSNEAASRALSAGHLVMLHLPLEPMSASEEAEPTVIKVGMDDAEIKQITAKAIASIPGLKGVNNHQGSKATSDRRVMNAVLSVIKSENLFFIDSRTSAKSVAAQISQEKGIKTGENQIFLDNSSDIDAIKEQIYTAIRIAKKQGSVIAIGHARPNTVIAVRQMIPEIEAAGIRLVYANQLVD